ncbi:MAG: BioY family transporter [Rhodobacteraceae bacterium GWE1_64_9]|nr:MAG: BioY family transporter [Rhodobacteraceae bacterium GWE1_64_9]OHC48899.1 MAG: BioY family transporter [Rhodobacteraceae bacterium GWF1_65_7]HBD90794.1 BioY family transporter [Gemmobacter sp.]HBU16388.1 BioY family transporter [Gemmobacter sp.]
MERNLTHIALFAALIAVLGLVPKIDLISGVPITAQSLGIMLCGTVLGARRGALAVLLFLGLVAIGLPLLAGGRGGLGVFVSPTAGYLVGFPLAALVAGLVVEKWRVDVGVASFAGALLGGLGVMHLCGIIGMATVLGKTLPEAALLALPFLAGDLLKAGIAAGITRGLARVRPASVLSRA